MKCWQLDCWIFSSPGSCWPGYPSHWSVKVESIGRPRFHFEQARWWCQLWRGSWHQISAYLTSCAVLSAYVIHLQRNNKQFWWKEMCLSTCNCLLVCHTGPINLSCIWHGLNRVFFYSIVTEADCVIAYCGSACVNLEKSNFLIQRMYHIASSGCKQQLPI